MAFRKGTEDHKIVDFEHMEDADLDLGDLAALNYDDLDSVCKLQKTHRYAEVIQKVKDALEQRSEDQNLATILVDDSEFQLIFDCNALLVDLEDEIVMIQNFICDKYQLNFSEIEYFFHHQKGYAQDAEKILNEIITVGSVKQLPDDVLQKTVNACNRSLALYAAKETLLDFMASRMGYIAPNLSVIVGSTVAAKLMGSVGGLSALSKMPACNVVLLGAKRKTLAGLSTETSQFRVGYIGQAEIFQNTPETLRMRACRLLAEKSVLAARVDSTGGDPTRNTGRSFREEIHKKIEKWAESSC